MSVWDSFSYEFPYLPTFSCIKHSGSAYITVPSVGNLSPLRLSQLCGNLSVHDERLPLDQHIQTLEKRNYVSFKQSQCLSPQERKQFV